MTWSVCVCVCVCAYMLSCVQPFVTPWTGACLSSFPVHGIFRARILESVDLSYSKGSSPPRDRNCVSCNADGFFTAVPPGQSKVCLMFETVPFFNAIVTFYICAKPALTSYPSNIVANAGVRRQAENESSNSSISVVFQPLPLSMSLPGIPCFLFDQREQAFLMYVNVFICFPSPDGTLGCSPPRDFPGGPVVKTLCFECRGCGFNPWSGN